MPKHLVDLVNDYCLHKLGVLPDLASPKGYNDKVNWLKIHDQMTEQVTCCDKLLVRAYVADRIGRSCLLDVYQMARSVDQIAFEALPERIKRTYGVAKGEWAYSHISPYVFAEECMQGPIVDYKFHCALGDIHWVQIIADRAAGIPRETIVDQNYTTLPLHMDHKMVHEPQAPPRPGSWDGMKTLARPSANHFAMFGLISITIKTALSSVNSPSGRWPVATKPRMNPPLARCSPSTQASNAP